MILSAGHNPPAHTVHQSSLTKSGPVSLYGARADSIGRRSPARVASGCQLNTTARAQHTSGPGTAVPLWMAVHSQERLYPIISDKGFPFKMHSIALNTSRSAATSARTRCPRLPGRVLNTGLRCASLMPGSFLGHLAEMSRGNFDPGRMSAKVMSRRMMSGRRSSAFSTASCPVFGFADDHEAIKKRGEQHGHAVPDDRVSSASKMRMPRSYLRLLAWHRDFDRQCRSLSRAGVHREMFREQLDALAEPTSLAPVASSVKADAVSLIVSRIKEASTSRPNCICVAFPCRMALFIPSWAIRYKINSRWMAGGRIIDSENRFQPPVRSEHWRAYQRKAASIPGCLKPRSQVHCQSPQLLDRLRGELSQVVNPVFDYLRIFFFLHRFQLDQK